MTSPNQAPAGDLLMEFAKKAAVSFKHTPINKVRRLEVRSYADKAQTTDFRTKQPAFWDPKPGQTQGDPKLAIIFTVLDDETGEERTLWAPKPSSMLTALINAQTEAGVQIAPGGVLEVYQYGTKPSDKGEDQKLYKAKYTPPVAGRPAVDPLAEDAPTSDAPPSGFGAGPVASDEPPF